MTAPPAGISRRGFLRASLGVGAAALAGPGLLSACSSGSKRGPNDLSFMYWGSSYEDRVVRTMLGEFSQKAGVKTVPLFTPGTQDQYATKMNVLVASGDAPTANYAHAYMGLSLAERNQALNVFPYFDKYPEFTERLPGTYYFWDDGKCLGNETGPTINCLYYLRPAFEEAGLDTPPAKAADAWTWDKFVETAIALTLDDNGRNPSQSGYDPDNVKQFGVSGYFNNFSWYSFVRSNGGDLTNADGTEYTLDSPEAVEALQHLADLIHEHRVSPIPKPGGASGSDTSTDFRTRRVAMAFDGTWAMLNLNQEKIPFGIGVHPKHQQSLTVQQSGCTMLNAHAENPDKAVEFYLFHNDPTIVTELFTSGLWMPLNRKYYTDEASIKMWTDNENHPPEFRTAVIDYIQTNSVTHYGQRLRNMSRIRDVVEPAIERVQQGREPVKKICKDLRDRVTPLLDGAYPNPMEART